MKVFGAGLLTAGLLIAVSGGCKEKTEEPVTNAPAQAPPPSFPEAQVPRAEPQPPPQPAEPPQPVDTTANPRPTEHEHVAPRVQHERQMPKESYAQTEKKVNQTYVVKKGDTLQKISQKYYGTTKEWRKIYQANKKTLKSPDKLTEGEKLIIP